uniref:Ig-like domain-containing protein n=1 Tax=Catharus ustulatus TaxID=91951 RepID=A0A8C3Y2E0_CATUS
LESISVFPLVSCSCDGDRVSFGCLASGFFPTPAAITWEGVASGEALSFPEVSTASDALSVTSRVTAPAEEAEGGEFVCRVQHRSSDVTATPPTPPTSSCCPQPSPSVLILPPSLRDLYLSPSPNLTCVASNLKSPRVKFTWERSGGGGALGVATSGPAHRLPSGLYELRNFLGVCAEDWNSGDVFTCKVTEEETGEELSASARKDVDAAAVAPKVFAFPPPPEELAASETATLTCLASGFRPRDVLVTWTQQDAPVDERKFSVLGPEEDAGSSGTFSVYSKLSVPAEEWRRGDVFGCVVGHDGIQGVRFIQRNLDKAAARPASVNVSVVLADSDLVCY